jgi:hypothetical protein
MWRLPRCADSSQPPFGDLDLVQQGEHRISIRLDFPSPNDRTRHSCQLSADAAIVRSLLPRSNSPRGDLSGRTQYGTLGCSTFENSDEREAKPPEAPVSHLPTRYEALEQISGSFGFRSICLALLPCSYNVADSLSVSLIWPVSSSTR